MGNFITTSSPIYNKGHEVHSSEELIKAILDLNEDKALEITRERLEKEDSSNILNDLRKAAEIIGEKYEKGEFFVADLVMAGEILKAVSNLAREKLRSMGKTREVIGKFVIGTVEGDVHDIGKTSSLLWLKQLDSRS